MTVSVTYVPDLNRVRVAYSSAPAGTNYALVERSLDGITWATVRGGEQVTATSSAGSIDDYEFVPGVLNTYRVTYVDSDAIQPNGFGTFTTGNNATLNPPLPGTVVNGSMMLLFVTHANVAASITTPTGWTLLAAGASHMAVFYRVMAGGVTAPSVAFTGGAAGDSCSAQIRAWSNADVPVHVALLTNGSAQNVAYPGGTLAQDGICWVMHQWKKSASTGAGTPSLMGDPQGGSNTAGANNEAQFTWRTDATVNIRTITAGSSTWTGGVAAVSKARLLRMTRRVSISSENGTITPTFTQVWIKNLQRPYMNTALSTPVGELSIKQAARAGVFPIKGRSLPVAVTDLRGGRDFTIGAQVTDSTERDRLKQILKAGEPILLHIPPGPIRLESMYAVILDIEYDDEASIMWMPLSEVAAPAASIVGSTVLWQDIVNTYATWTDLLAAKATWADVLASVGSPTDIITG